MDDTLAQWLGLRERADTAARSPVLTKAVADAVAVHDPIHVLDLATGTGSNIRYLVNHLGPHQHWLAVDHSAALLAELPIRMSQWEAARGRHIQECHVETRRMSLARLDDPELFSGRHLVTASALLDLVSEEWLRSLAARCSAAGAAALFTITYNGRSSCSPAEPEDDLILDLFNRHQKTDKGLGGPAAGPDAAACAVRGFGDAGYRVRREPSDWTLGPADAELQRQLIDGWASAAAEIAPDAAPTIVDWKIRRFRHVDAGRSRIVVGHDDVAAWLPIS